ncbi:MAG: 30S ribosomal protein S16 [Acetivibrionales bacterium]|nr:30S ribosomal protein S16 [Clostridiaceae bacterium]
MMVKIRLKRIGAKKKPFYRIIVADGRSPRDGKFIEQVGTYDPKTEPSAINVDAEKVKKWLSNGAQPTDTVKKLLKIAGVTE